MHRAGDPRQRFCFATSCEVALRGGLTERTVSPGRRDVIQEGLHPDYWGQVAMRNCLRQLWNNGGVLNAAVGSYWHCNDTSSSSPSGLDSQNEPLVTLTSGLG